MKMYIFSMLTCSWSSVAARFSVEFWLSFARGLELRLGFGLAQGWGWSWACWGSSQVSCLPPSDNKAKQWGNQSEPKQNHWKHTATPMQSHWKTLKNNAKPKQTIGKQNKTKPMQNQWKA